MHNNPIRYKDPTGHEKIISFDNKNEVDSRITSGAQKYKDDNAIHIFAHGNQQGITVFEDGKKKRITSGDQLDQYLSKKSEIWKSREEGEKVTIVLHACKTGRDGNNGNESFAQKVSKELKDVKVIAPTERVYIPEKGEIGSYKAKYADKNGEYLRDGHGEIKSKERSDELGKWRVFEGGKETGSYSGDWKPKEKPTLYDKLFKKD